MLARQKAIDQEEIFLQSETPCAPPLRPGSGRLRIAMAASSLVRAGAEKQFVYMTRALHRTGADLRVFHFGQGGFYERILKSTRIPLFNLSCGGRPFRTLGASIRAFLQFRPHIVLASQFGDIIHAGVAGRLCGALTLAGVRSDGFWEMNHYGRRTWLMRRLPHALVANSLKARQNLASLGIDPQRVKVLANVIDLQHFDQQRTQPITHAFPPGRTVVAAVGRLHPDKRFDRALEAVALARRSFPPVACLLVGRDQGAKGRLEQRARELGLLPDHLIFTGESDNVPALLNQSHLLLHCSDYEGFPNAILEAMAAGLPVITTPVGDASSVVENARVGYVVGFDDTKAMGDRIVEIATSAELRRSLGKAARDKVEQHYTCEGLSHRLLAILEEVAQQRQRTKLLAILHNLREGPERVVPLVPLVEDNA